MFTPPGSSNRRGDRPFVRLSPVASPSEREVPALGVRQRGARPPCAPRAPCLCTLLVSRGGPTAAADGDQMSSGGRPPSSAVDEPGAPAETRRALMGQRLAFGEFTKHRESVVASGNHGVQAAEGTITHGPYVISRIREAINTAILCLNRGLGVEAVRIRKQNHLAPQRRRSFPRPV